MPGLGTIGLQATQAVQAATEEANANAAAREAGTMTPEQRRKLFSGLALAAGLLFVASWLFRRR